MESIQAYPDRKVEVNFRIGEKIEGTDGGQKLDPHLSTYPVHESSFAQVWVSIHIICNCQQAISVISFVQNIVISC